MPAASARAIAPIPAGWRRPGRSRPGAGSPGSGRSGSAGSSRPPRRRRPGGSAGRRSAGRGAASGIGDRPRSGRGDAASVTRPVGVSRRPGRSGRRASGAPGRRRRSGGGSSSARTWRAATSAPGPARRGRSTPARPSAGQVAADLDLGDDRQGRQQRAVLVQEARAGRGRRCRADGRLLGAADRLGGAELLQLAEDLVADREQRRPARVRARRRPRPGRARATRPGGRSRACRPTAGRKSQSSSAVCGMIGASRRVRASCSRASTNCAARRSGPSGASA